MGPRSRDDEEKGKKRSLGNEMVRTWRLMRLLRSTGKTGLHSYFRAFGGVTGSYHSQEEGNICGEDSYYCLGFVGFLVEGVQLPCGQLVHVRCLRRCLAWGA